MATAVVKDDKWEINITEPQKTIELSTDGKYVDRDVVIKVDTSSVAVFG